MKLAQIDGSGAAERPLLRVRALKKDFPVGRPLFARLLRPREGQTVKAIDGLDLEIRRGQTLSLVGESGCGKSTVARVIMGLLACTSGTIEFDGADISRVPPGRSSLVRRRMQMIFQDPYASLNPRWRIHRIIAEPMRSYRIFGSPAEERREVDRLLEFVGLSMRDGEKYPHEFSGGQRQRISIARAVSTKPEFLVCDEPTSALDVSVQAQILNLMRELQRDIGLTYLFISHDLAVVNFMSDHIGVMYLGRLVEIAQASELFATPMHPYTQVLLETIPDLSMTKRGRVVATGEVPNPIHPPSGCHFHPRCPLANDRCRVERPALRSRQGSGSVACHAVEEGRMLPPPGADMRQGAALKSSAELALRVGRQ